MFKCPNCKEELNHVSYEEFGNVNIETAAEDGNRDYTCPNCKVYIEYKSLPEKLK